MPSGIPPRGVVVEAPLPNTIIDPGHTHTWRAASGAIALSASNLMISTGEKLVPWDSEEGRAVACSIATNVDAKCAIMHRRRHWPRP